MQSAVRKGHVGRFSDAQFSEGHRGQMKFLPCYVLTIVMANGIMFLSGLLYVSSSCEHQEHLEGIPSNFAQTYT